MFNTGTLVRLTPAAYADFVGAPRSGVDPMTVAATVFDQNGQMPDALHASHLFVSWGQFLDHDLSLSPDKAPEIMTAPGLVAPIHRSLFEFVGGSKGTRVPINVVTPEIDGSMIYGSDAARLASLREFSGGRLLMDSAGLMPMTSDGGEMAGASSARPLFMAGDVRANENTGLTTLHTLFVREHNQWADTLSRSNPGWSDDRIFAAARSIVEAEIQKITYEDWLPILLGEAVGAHTGHDPAVTTQISVEFSTAAFRFGHTMISPTVARMDEDGSTSAGGDIAVMDAFFDIAPLSMPGSIDAILRGLAGSYAQTLDSKIVDDLNRFLTTPDGITGFSLAALNILRGRDHGLGTYVDIRAQLLGDIDPSTLDPLDFSIITGDVARQAELAAAHATVFEVEPWVGGLAEDPVAGTHLGPLFTYIVAEQFVRTRAGDATFGVLDPAVSPEIAAAVAQTTLADIIERNTSVSYLQDDVFTVAPRLGGSGTHDIIHGTGADELIAGFSGRDLLVGRGGDDTIFGGTGPDTIRGAMGDDDLHGEAGRDKVIGGSGNDTIDGGGGNDYLHGGQGRDVFVFSQGSGKDRIGDFTPFGDVIDLSGQAVADFAELMTHATIGWSGVTFDFGADVLILSGVALHQLDPADFVFA